MNKIILIGNLVADPEQRTGASGNNFATFRIAVSRRFTNAQGVRETDFINCIAFSKTAEFICRYFTKGRKIGIEGSLQSRTYDAQDGSKRTAYEVVVDNAEFVDSKPEGSAPAGRPMAAPAPAAPAAPNGFASLPEEEDDLPF